jgi:hypothetical protein
VTVPIGLTKNKLSLDCNQEWCSPNNGFIVDDPYTSHACFGSIGGGRVGRVTVHELAHGCGALGSEAEQCMEGLELLSHRSADFDLVAALGDCFL